MSSPSQGSVSFTNSTQVYVTKPETEIRHFITDDQLSELCSMRKDHVVEIFWGTLGAVLGLITSFWSVASKVKSGTVISGAEFFEAGAFLISFAICLFSAFLWRNRHKGGKSLEERIRERPQDVMV